MTAARLTCTLMLLLLSGLAGPALATGGMSSGGGGLLKDSRNPWFIQNTTAVTYCVIRDPAYFSLQQSTAERRIREAFAYWKDEFSRSFDVAMQGMRVRIATQSFRQTGCDQNPDIQFRLGTLLDEQRAMIGDPTELVAVAMRTDYDRVQLRGKGFIYIAPDAGPLKPKAELLDQVWLLGDGGMFYRVLVHELGHVFGLPDSDVMPISTRGTGMMSAAYPEYITAKSSDAAGLAFDTRLPYYFNFTRQSSDEHCSTSIGAKMSAFFGIPSNWHCSRLIYKVDGLEVWAKAEDNDHTTYTMIGSATFDRIYMSDSQPSVSLSLSREQRVFANDEENFTYVWSGFVQYSTGKGTYRTLDGSIVRQISVTPPLNERPAHITGVSDDAELLGNVSMGI